MSTSASASTIPADGAAGADRAAFFERLIKELSSNTRFIANEESGAGVKLVPRAISAVSNHRVLHEQIPGKDGAPPTERPHVAFILGQTGTHAEGQRLGAAGTTPANVKIDDQTHVKFTIICKAAGDDIPELADFWTDQSVGLYERACALVGGADAYQALLGNRAQFVRPFVREHSGNKRDISAIGGLFANQFLPLVTKDIYTTVPPSAGSRNAAAQVPVRTARKRRAAEVQDLDGEVPPAETQEEPVAPAVTLDSRYDPTLMPDHRGSQFRHVHAQLLQPNITDMNGNLIAPWDLANALRPGTLFIAACNLRLWDMPAQGAGGNGQSKGSMTFQTCIESLKVIRESDLPLIDASHPVVPVQSAQTAVQLPADIAEDFNSFAVSISPFKTLIPSDVDMPDASDVGNKKTEPSAVAKGKRRKA
ncbi:hypothetical protein FA95DRAFT_1122597 [Auriscalpium vulgare]|uniref:Uncharacterized protein n=1 Tax=Auriscalpium vulgare TaxID=40419 RepID=A0ACB8R4C3_9AGAM|nr:hypothetical protein FA95DRAFT_1122597 [Auriscalpium vulgare]